MEINDIKFSIILLSALTKIIITTIWYSDAVCGKAWLRALDQKSNNVKGLNLWSFMMGIITAFLMAFVLSVFIIYAKAFTPFEGVEIAFLAWLGFVVPTEVTGVIFAKKPLNLFLISGGCDLLSLIIMGAIIGYGI
jgi:hypothetical protein